MERGTDTYPEGPNLKGSSQMERGTGKHLKFNDDTEFPANFSSDLLRNSDSKREFYHYDKVLSKSQHDDKSVVCIRNEKTVTNYKATCLGINIPDCTHIEADTHIILHVLDYIRKGIRNIIVRSVDTDVVVLLIAYMPIILENGDIKVIAKCGIGKNLENLSINAISQHTGLERCRQIFFFSLVY